MILSNSIEYPPKRDHRSIGRFLDLRLVFGLSDSGLRLVNEVEVGGGKGY